MAFSPETYALLLKMIEEGGGGGGSGLPAVTAADNGKVLSVVNGAWAADARGKVVINESDVLDKSFNDLLAMFNQGITPWLVYYYEEDDDDYIYRMPSCSFLRYNGEIYIAGFTYIDVGNNVNAILFVSADPDEPMFWD